MVMAGIWEVRLLSSWFVKSRSRSCIRTMLLKKSELLKRRDKLKISEVCSSERNRDVWEDAGLRGRWTRAHRIPRRSLFTPYRVSQGPRRDARLDALRVTRGVYTSGERFECVDEWESSANAHRVLPEDWTGTTTLTCTDSVPASSTLSSSIPSTSKPERIKDERERGYSKKSGYSAENDDADRGECRA